MYDTVAIPPIYKVFFARLLLLLNYLFFVDERHAVHVDVFSYTHTHVVQAKSQYNAKRFVGSISIHNIRILQIRTTQQHSVKRVNVGHQQNHD